MPRTARLAILSSSLLHGALILAGRYRMSYDAYNHMFFGDHYRLEWWSLWDERWYAGFFVTSYPPLAHQIIGLLSRLVGLEAAFAILLWITLTVFPAAVYAFARVFLGERSSGYAALGAAFLPSAYLTAHIFGQLPTLAAAVTALFGAAALAAFLRSGDRLNGALGIACMGTTMAFHHATLMLLPWLVLAVLSRVHSRREVKSKDLFVRLLAFGVLSSATIALVIWPFWDWGRGQELQTPIDHASRHNFLHDPLAALMFFLPVYGPLLVFVPSAFRIGTRRRYRGLGAALLLLFLLGLGDTTPLPRWIFGAGWEWLTYDRFAFWASLLLLPFLGIMIAARVRSRRDFGRKVFATLATASLIVGLITVFLPLQPGPVKMGEIVDFLEADGRSAWRYLTFGFGDQLARLSTLTSATTIDGSYHTARTLPELRASGLGQIDTAYWLTYGFHALPPILEKAGAHGVRWGFVNIPQYVPVLEASGWAKRATLPSGVQVWENPGAVLPPPVSPPPQDLLASFSWGTLPVLSLFITISLGAVRLWPLEAVKALRRLYHLVITLVPVALSFWYFRIVGEFTHARVYFTYDHALFFLSDALVLLAVVIWLILHLSPNATHVSPTEVHGSWRLPAVLLGLALLASISITWAADWRTSLYISLHLWLVLLLILSMREMGTVWRPLMLGLSAALAVQIVAGLVGFATQSTAFLAPLGLNWPGSLDPSVRGAVVVPLPDGMRVLRAYGTFPHPNILAGFTLICLLGPASLFLSGRKTNHPALILFALGVALLALTFSRSAWLGLGFFSLVLIVKSRFLDRRRLGLFLISIFLSFVITLVPYISVVQARTVDISSNAEQFSFIGRAWLNGEALQMLSARPLTGVGAGSFVIELARRAGEGYVIEPAHNLILLAGAELGAPGMILMAGFYAAVGWVLVTARAPNQILAGALLAALAVIGLFDHYLWTIAPGRVMLGLAVGLACFDPRLNGTR